MRSRRVSRLRPPALCVIGLIGGCFLIAGCGSDDAAPRKNDSSAAQSNAAQDSSLPTVSISARKPAASDDVPKTEFKKGTPEWLLREITLMRIRPLVADANTDNGKEPSAEEVAQRLRQQESALRSRNQEIISLAEKAIVLTHDIAEKAREFELAVHHLMEAHMQLALMGDQKHIDALYETADTLFKRDPKSKAAADASYQLVEFAQQNAARFADDDPRWLTELARLSRLFAERFPQEESRGAPLLLAAGQSCELHGMTDEATTCYATATNTYPDTPASQQAAAILRRLNLPGKVLKLAGPTIDGDYISIDQYRGRAVLIVFWSSPVKRFREQLPELRAAIGRVDPRKLAVLGVCLDTDELAVEKFLEQQQPPIGWKQIFHPEKDERGWQNPIAVHYGIQRIPAYWLVGPDGRVATLSPDLANLPKLVDGLLRRRGTASGE